MLSSAESQIEAKAKEIGYKRPLALDPHNFNHEISDAPYISFLEQLPALLADEERRIKAGAVDRVLDDPKKYPDKAKRVAALMRDLEVVSARQWGQPGGVGLDSDPVPVALEKEGTDAVEPLIDCLEKDDRLTRSVSFGRDFHQGRSLHTVGEAAYGAIAHILQVAQFGPATEHGYTAGYDDRTTVVAEVRDYWKKHKGQSAEEQWYQILCDDNAQPRQWLEAASRIVQPVDEEMRGGWTSVPRRKPGDVPPMRGESLRAKKNPTVTELLIKRIPQIAASEPENSNGMFHSDEAASVARALAIWDPKAAAPSIKAEIAECKEKAAHWKQYTDTAER